MAALVALAMVFAGCAQPTDMNITTDGVTTLVKLDNPVVHVTAYDGFNVVSWEPVRDAATYTVWRLDTQSSSQIRIASGTTFGTGSTLSVVDNVADTTVAAEKLANGRAYKYIVVADPNLARVNDNATGTVSDAHSGIYAGKGEATVTARVPDPATYKVPKATDIKTRLDPNGYLYVSWTQPANAKAKIGYFIGGYPADAALSPEAFDAAFYLYSDTYVAGSPPASTIDYLFTTSGAGYLYPRNAVTAVFPVIGGKATIAIQTEYLTDKAVQSTGNVYARDNPAKLDITLDQYNLELNWTGTSFTATHIYKDATTGTVQLSWPRIYGDEDAYSSTPYSTKITDTYKVFKREIPLNQDTSGLGGSLVGAGNWTPVAYTPLEPADGHQSNIIYAVETAEVKSSLSGWQYIVYAEARGSKTSHSYPLTAWLARTLPAEPTIAAVVEYGGNPASDGHPYTNKITITSGLANGVSYKLYRGELTPILTTTNGRWIAPSSGTQYVPIENANYQFAAYDPAAVREWTGELVVGDSSAIIYDTNIVARKTYIYKLVSSMGDTLLGDGSTSAIYPASTRDAASVYSSLVLTVAPLTFVSGAQGAQGDDTNRGWIHATLENRGYTKGMDAKLFYRTPGATVTKWEELAPFVRNDKIGNDVSQTTDENGRFKDLDIPVPNAVFGENYEFKAVAYLAGKEIPNLDGADYTVASTTPTPPPPYTYNYTYAAVVEKTATSELSKAGGPIGVSGNLSWPSSPAPTLSLSSATAQSIYGITGDFLDGASVDIRVARVTVRTKQMYFDQGSFSIAQTGTTNSYQITTLVLANETVPDNDNVPTGTDNYSVQWKYPWEKWESQTHAWWLANRQIAAVNNH